MTQMNNVTMNGRAYRYKLLEDTKGAGIRWQILHAEYWNELRKEWRLVRNWNTKERLFELSGYADKKAQVQA